MAVIQIDVNDNVAADVRDTLYTFWGGLNNPSNAVKMAFLKSYLAASIKAQYKEVKGRVAGDAARLAASNTADSADIT